MTVEPVAGERALEISGPAGRYIVAADLHVGIEEQLARCGFRVPDQTDRNLERLRRLVDERKPSGLVLLGDVKHQVPYAERWEKRKVFRLLDELSALVPVTVVSGNHDGGIGTMAPGRVRRVGSLVLGSIGLVHGHAWPPERLMRCKTLVLAHAHPSVLLCDERGRPVTEACWLRAGIVGRKAKERYGPPFPEIVLMPAFTDLRGGFPVNGRGGRLLGPLFRNGLVDVPRARVYLTDGTFLGCVRDLLPVPSPAGRYRM
ncbi:MAG: metallophosphoesterase [Euryarchaeota archaeon]|nr:metallophosphoesterase [Euryarchaeota archaeon]